MLNKVILMGRLTKEPELRHTQSDVPVVSFTLAVDRGFKPSQSLRDSSPEVGAKGASVDFINVVAWRGTAEFVAKWFTKGQLVAVSGRLQVRSYKDRDGNGRTATEVVADEAFFAENKRNNAEGTYDTGKADFAENEPVQGGFEEIIGDDGKLPF